MLYYEGRLGCCAPLIYRKLCAIGNFVLCLFNKGEHFFGGHLVAHVGAFEERVGEGTLGVVETENLLFDGVFGNEVIDGDLLLLADAVGAVGGLLFDGRIPPGVKVDDVIGPSEVEAEAARLE